MFYQAFESQRGLKGCTEFLSKVKRKFVNNSCSNWYRQISIFPHQNPPFLGPAEKSIKLIVIGICLDNTAAAQRNISGCRYNCEVCEMKLTWKTYSTVLFYPFYDIYSLAYSSIANMKASLIYTIITLKTATQHLKVSFALTDMRIQWN